MPRRSARVRRTPGEWSGRLALALLVGGLGYAGVTFSLAQAVASGSPALAHRLAPYDGRVTARLAASMAGPEATAADRVRADRLADRALRQDPTAVFAVSTLGINAQIRGDTATARRFFAYAQRLSRRHLQTQLWAIEDAVSRGDVAGVLRQYDVALRTNPTMSEMLFPVLASAATDPAIRGALIRTLAARPVWGERFIVSSAASGAHPRETAALLLGLRRVGVPVPASAHANTVNALLSASLFDKAWAYYAAIRPGVDRRRSRNLRSAGIDVPSQLDWVIIDEGGATTTIGEGAVDFAVGPSVGGALLRQGQVLPPGDYRLTGRSEGLDQAEGARPYWRLTCGDTRELGRVVVPSSSQAGGRFSGVLGVPAGCPQQALVLVARPSDAIAGVSGRIDRIQLVPVR